MTIEATHPGDILHSEYLKPHGITQERLAFHTGLSRVTINEIVNRRRNVTPRVSILLGAALGTSSVFWLSLQAAYDLIAEQEKMRRRKEAVLPGCIIPKRRRA